MELKSTAEGGGLTGGGESVIIRVVEDKLLPLVTPWSCTDRICRRDGWQLAVDWQLALKSCCPIAFHRRCGSGKLLSQCHRPVRPAKRLDEFLEHIRGLEMKQHHPFLMYSPGAPCPCKDMSAARKTYEKCCYKRQVA